MILTIFWKRRSVEHAEFVMHLGCRKPCFLQLLAHIYTNNYEILNKIKFDRMSLPHLKYFTQAGGALRKDLIDYFLKYSEKNKKKFLA